MSLLRQKTELISAQRPVDKEEKLQEATTGQEAASKMILEAALLSEPMDFSHSEKNKGRPQQFLSAGRDESLAKHCGARLQGE